MVTAQLSLLFLAAARAVLGVSGRCTTAYLMSLPTVASAPQLTSKVRQPVHRRGQVPRANSARAPPHSAGSGGGGGGLTLSPAVLASLPTPLRLSNAQRTLQAPCHYLVA